jgi:alpha-1,4-glucan:alpha-1,4-glucan 6-glycosyltransferase
VDLSAAQRKRATRFGIEVSWEDAAGVVHEADPESVLAVLAALEAGGAPRKQRDRGRGRSAVERCHELPTGGDPASRRVWGGFMPLYAMRGDHDEGIGTVSDLTEMGEWLGSLGARVMSTLPLLAGFNADPCEPSPYSPVSRRFWNELFLDASLIDGIDIVAFPAGEVAAVDRPSVAVRQRERLSPYAIADDSAEFLAWLAADPEVNAYARFRAAGERHGVAWRDWPDAWNRQVPDDAVDPDAVRWHEWAQFQMHRQLGDASRRLREVGVTLAADLPVGTHPDGFDRWRHRHLFVDSAAIGAPPDLFQPDGQDWGLSPMHPSLVASAEGIAFLDAILDHHLAVAGALRIDHVMGLHRQWWVPAGAPASRGVYVRFPADDLWDAIARASQRHGAGVVGEDLGTVPVEVREALSARNVLGCYVAQFELLGDSTSLGHGPTRRTVASLSTHDLAPFAAYWRENGDAMKPASIARDEVLAQLAVSDADIVLIDVDDLWLDDRRHNTPGTVGPHNWTHRSRLTIAEMQVDPDVAATLGAIDAFRRLPEHLVSDLDLHLFNEGTHSRLSERFGARAVEAATPDDSDGFGSGVVFSVWAPNARAVSVIGDASGWDTGQPLHPVASSGVWAGVVGHARPGQRYKYRITGRDGSVIDRADPLATAGEGSPGHASIVDSGTYDWNDATWMHERPTRHRHDHPLSIYEVHLGSWRRNVAEDRPLTYREVAPELADYLVANGFTHVEFMPLMEHPFTPSWGYQVTGFFQATARYGTPDDLRFLIDHLHQRGIGVILDWVPAHFPADRFALAQFDGTHLYEHADPREGQHPDWGSLIFNYGRSEVRAFLISSACWWLESFHADGLRVDAVASMLYRDYSREPGEWVPNVHGGRENLEALSLLQACNDEIHRRFPDVLVAAEESTAWGGVTAATVHGGLGFDLKWDLGWMHDTLEYFRRDPVHRRWHQNELTFRQVYATHEKFVLALSHDEVVHGKGSLLAKMAGSDWQKRANLRLLFGYQHVLPGKKLVFMGGEFAQWSEWHHDTSLDWHLLDDPAHAGILRWVSTLNHLHRELPALHQLDHDGRGFEWIAADDADNSILVMARHGYDAADDVVAICNFTPTPRGGYRIGMPHPGSWELVVSSDAVEFGGAGYSAPGRIDAGGPAWNGQAQSAIVTAVPLGIVLYRRVH